MALRGPVRKFTVVVYYTTPQTAEYSVWADDPAQAEEIAKEMFKERYRQETCFLKEAKVKP